MVSSDASLLVRGASDAISSVVQSQCSGNRGRLRPAPSTMHMLVVAPINISVSVPLARRMESSRVSKKALYRCLEITTSPGGELRNYCRIPSVAHQDLTGAAIRGHHRAPDVQALVFEPMWRALASGV